MEQTMQHYNQYTPQSSLAWDGLNSQRFGKTRIMFPRRDLITTGLDMPHEAMNSGRKHYQEQLSPEHAFKPILKQFPPQIPHWHPRQSSKRIVQLQFTQPFPRKQKSHYKDPLFPHQSKMAGIRTFYNSRIKDGQRQYSVQDRIQRKVKVNQLQLRKNAFKDQSFLLSKSFQKYML